MEFEKKADILKALGHPIRLKMVWGLLCGKECNVNTMVKNLKLPQSTVSQHLQILKNNGIVMVRKDGVKACYRVENKEIKKIIKCLLLK